MASSLEYATYSPDLLQKRAEALEKRRCWREELKRLRTYLGGEKPTAVYTVPTHVSSSLCRSGNRPVLISLDIEAFEFNQDRITEIGISELKIVDDRLMQISYQDAAAINAIKSRHLRITENKHLVNKKHVQGCPDKFNFGKSEWISRGQIASTLKAIFKNTIVHCGNSQIKPVLIGQSIQSDIDYLRRSGFDLLPLISDCLDTNSINKVIRRNTVDRSLSSLLEDYSIEAKYLHNAGNDAHYTMRVLLASAQTKKQEASTKFDKNLEIEREIRRQKMLIEFKTRLRFEGWSDDEDDGEDAR